MQTTLHQHSDVDFALEVVATAEDLAGDFKKALRTQQLRTQMKGFRPGKVPTSLVKRMYGEAIMYTLAEQKVQDAYKENVAESDEYQVLGQSRITELEASVAGGIRAVIEFGVRPKVTLQDLSEVRLPRLVHKATDEEIDKEIERLRLKEADLIPLDTDTEITDEHFVDFTYIALDTLDGEPQAEAEEEEGSYLLTDLQGGWRPAFLGKKAGDTFRIEVDEDGEVPSTSNDETDDEPTETFCFEVTVKEVKRSELPEVDEDFIKQVTQDKHDDVASLREEIAQEIANSWDRVTRDVLEGMMVKKMVELHPIPVPKTVLENYLDALVEETKAQEKDELPDDFDEAAFREEQRERAIDRARWMILRDIIAADHDLEVKEEDETAHFEKIADDMGVDPMLLRQYFGASQEMAANTYYRILSNKVFDFLMAQFSFDEQDLETFQATMKAEANDEAEANDAAPATDEAPDGESPETPEKDPAE